ncbi:transposase, partial [Myxococcota bacterium]
MGQLRAVFTENTVDRLRKQTGYNPRKRVATAYRLLLVVVEAFLSGQTLGFTVIRAFFVKRFGSIRPRAFQLRFKSSAAVAFFKAALDHLVAVTCSNVGLRLEGVLAPFEDVQVFDGTGQRVPPRGAKKDPALKGCTKGKAGSKWVVGYSLRTGVAFSADADAETASEIKLWRRLVDRMQQGVLYLLDLGFFSKEIFREAQESGAHVLMRLKSGVKVRVLGNLYNGQMVHFPEMA